MKTRKLGSKGPEVSALALGCMGMSEFYGPASDAESLATLDLALERGVNFWDTADVYGPFRNEELLAQALKGRRQQIFLASKFGIVRDETDVHKRGVNGHPEYVRRSVEASLKRLGFGDRLYRSLLPAQNGSRGTDRGNCRCHGRVGAAGQGALSGFE